MITEKNLRFKLNEKLKLWDTPGFANFIEDLTEYMGVEVDIALYISIIHKLYKSENKIVQQEKLKFKQGKLNL